MYLELKLVGCDTAKETYDVFVSRNNVCKRGKFVTMAYLGSLNKLEQFAPDFRTHLEELAQHDSPELLTANVRWVAEHTPDVLGEDINSLLGKGGNLLADTITTCSPISEEAVVKYLLQPPKVELSEEMHQLLVQTDIALPVSYAPSPLGLVDAVVVAAGVGKRMGAALPKQYLQLGAYSILEHTVLKLLSSPYVAQVIVVCAEKDRYFEDTCLSRLQRVKTVIGGKERVDSVLQGIKAAKHPWVMVHDAARPLVSLGDIERLVLSVAVGYKQSGYVGGLLAAKVADTLKMVHSKNNDELEQEEKLSEMVAKELAQRKSAPADMQASWQVARVDKTVDRSLMYAAQTPQMFIRDVLIDAIMQAQQHDFAITDEASAMEFVGHKVLLVEGSKLNFKLTTRDDLLLLQSLVQAGNSGLYMGPSSSMLCTRNARK